MMLAAPAKLDLSEVQRREAWLKSDIGLGGTSGLFRSLSPKAILNAFKEVFSDQSSRDPSLTESVLDDFTVLNSRAVKDAEYITDAEANWLIQALNGDGEIDANERALLEFIRHECPEISETLRPLLGAA